MNRKYSSIRVWLAGLSLALVPCGAVFAQTPTPAKAEPAVAVPTVAQSVAAAPTPLARRLPLPPAMVRLSIPDVAVFDGAMGGGFKKALHGTLPENDPVLGGFNQSQVGTKLWDQWTRFKGDENEISFETLLDLQASSASLAILNAGHLEMALVMKTPLAELPETFEEGTARVDHGLAYHLIRPGAADEGAADPETRMGFAWARQNGLLIVTTSERAMKLALAAAASNARFVPKLDGLASLELDMEALGGDLYFKREFQFASLSTFHESKGVISAALRLEAGQFVEVREGALEKPGGRGVTFDAGDALASGWVGDSSELLREIRSGLIEPVAEPKGEPLVALGPLPSARAGQAEDRYAVNIEVPLRAGATTSEAGEIADWKKLLASQAVDGFGYIVTRTHARLIAIPWPKDKDADIEALLSATLTRRGARLAGSTAAYAQPGGQYSFGPDLPVFAWKRSGDFLWFGPTLAALQNAPLPTWNETVLRFAKVSLAGVREEGKRWARIEGPRSNEEARPLSDRVLGVLGWMPAVRTISVERRAKGSGFTERVIFGIAR